MVKKNSKAKVTQPKVVIKMDKKISKKKKVKTPKPVFGPIATIDTAPVSIGNSVKGAAPVVIPINDGVRIQGRDFFCNVAATAASVTGWTLVGGAPLVPHALVSSLLKSYAGIYAFYVVHGFAFHYITACPSSVQGDVMFYVSKNLANPALDSSSNNFMSVVLSDHCTVFGPLWQNHTASFFPPERLYPTDMLNDEDLEHHGPGELLMYTKSTSTQVPGYVLIDYDISFITMQVNVRALTFPITRMKYTQVALTRSATAVTAGATVFEPLVTGTLLDGTTSGSLPLSAAAGDIYKVICCITPATFTNATASNLTVLEINTGSALATNAITLRDGYTFYALYNTTNAFMFYPTYQAAVTQTNWIQYGVTASVTYNIPAFVGLVGNFGSTLSQSNI